MDKLTTSFKFAPLLIRISVEILSEFIIEIWRGVIPKFKIKELFKCSRNSSKNIFLIEIIFKWFLRSNIYHNRWAHLSPLSVWYFRLKVVNKQMLLKLQRHEVQSFPCCHVKLDPLQMLTGARLFLMNYLGLQDVMVSVKKMKFENAVLRVILKSKCNKQKHHILFNLPIYRRFEDQWWILKFVIHNYISWRVLVSASILPYEWD